MERIQEILEKQKTLIKVQIKMQAKFTMLKPILMSSVALVLGSAAQGADADRIPFVEIAPANSMMVIAVDDMEGMLRQLEATPLSGLSEIDSVQKMMTEKTSSIENAIIADFLSSLDTFLKPP